jgi:hypothetical protein
MSATTYPGHGDDWSAQPDEGSSPPRRRRRVFFNRRGAALVAVITCTGGFFAGIEVEKGQLSTASAAVTAGASRAGAGAGGFGGGAGGFGGGAGASGDRSFGTVSSVDANTIYLTDSSGNTVKVSLSASTKLSKSQTVSQTAVRPGDSVLIQGLKNTNGTLVATSVSDSGAAPSAPTGGSASGASAGGSSTGAAGGT